MSLFHNALKMGVTFSAGCLGYVIEPKFTRVVKEWIPLAPTQNELVDKTSALASSLLACSSFAIPAGLKWGMRGFALGATVPSTALFAFAVLGDIQLKRYAIKGRGDETVMYVVAKYDDNGSTHLPNFAVLKLAKGRKLVVRRVGSLNELQQLLRQQKNVSHVWIHAHGNPKNIIFEKSIGKSVNRMSGDELSKVFLDAQRCNTHLFNQHPEIVLQSCSAGRGFAQELYKGLGGRFSVTAPQFSVRPWEAHVKEGRVQFKTPSLMGDQTVHLHALQCR